MSRHPRWRTHQCHRADAKTRDRLRCDVPGDPPRPPRPGDKSLGTLTVNGAEECLLVCPVSHLWDDPLVVEWIEAHALVERWNRWPSGRPDPRALEAIVTIAATHDRLDAEEREEQARKK